jgi:tetratricopeptide (TPR) repeat protein
MTQRSGLLLTLSLLAAMGATSAQGAQVERPVILIVQLTTPNMTEVYAKDAETLDLLPQLKKAFANDGRLKPVVWSRKDPLFEEGMGSIAIPDEPTDELISEAARRLKARYILRVEAVKTEDKVFPRAELFQTGRRGTLWTAGGRRGPKGDSQAVQVGGQVDWNATAGSLADTWMLQMGQGPLRSLGVGSPVLPNPFESNPDASLPRVELGATAGQEALQLAEEMIRSGRTSRAVIFLKDAVDANPFEPLRRIRLMELMVEEGLAEEAAEEGRRAARLASSRPELWLASAKAWLLAEKPQEAEIDVKEAMTRGVDTPLAHRLLGDVALIKGDLPRARDEYSLSLEKEDSVRCRLGLAISFSLIGQPTLAQAILQKNPPVAGPLDESEYSFLADMMSPIMKRVGRELADLNPAARINQGSAAVTSRAEALVGQASALASVISQIQSPERHNSSHGARLLAHKLMVQASQEVLSFAKGGDPEAGLEVVMSLGEALRQLGLAQELYREERQGSPTGPP